MNNTFLYPKFTIAYVALSIIVIVSGWAQLTWTYYLTKPMVLLMLFFFYRIQTGNVQNKSFRNFILAGFLLSAAGDTVLMFTDHGQVYLLTGLVLFLLAHGSYILGFLNDILKNRPWNQHWGQLAFSTLLVVYGAEFYIINRFSFGEMSLPVMIYCIGITAMGVTAAMRDRTHNFGAYLMVCVGSVFFMISDSLLATQLFITPYPFSGQLILGTYFLAQYLIGIGTLARLKNQKIPLAGHIAEGSEN